MRRRAAIAFLALGFLVGALAVPASATAPLVYRLRGIGDARQVVAVTNTSWTSTYATLRAYEKRADGTWRAVFGPWTARVGRNGFGSPKREGDGQSPVGSFTVPKLFGVRANPGVRVPWFRVVSNDVWVDDPAS